MGHIDRREETEAAGEADGAGDTGRMIASRSRVCKEEAKPWGYVYFTEEQKERANTVDLKDFLERQERTAPALRAGLAGSGWCSGMAQAVSRLRDLRGLYVQGRYV